MVQLTNVLVLSVFAVLPVLAAPLGEHGGGHFRRVHAPAHQTEGRDVAQIDARDPKISFGNIFKTATHIAGKFIREDDGEELDARDLDENEIDSRDPINFGKIFKGAAHIAGKFIREDDGEELDARDLDENEIDSRDPINFGKIFKGAAHIAGKFIREDDGEELDVRDFDENEIEARLSIPLANLLCHKLPKRLRKDCH